MKALRSEGRLGLALLILSALGSGWASAGEGGAYSVAKTLEIGGNGNWDYATIDDKGQRLYLPRGNHTLVVDAETGKQVADIKGGGRTHGVALAPDEGRGFITDGKEGKLIIFDIKSHEVLGSIPAADDADGVIYDSGSHRVLVTCGDAGELIVVAPDVDPKQGKPEATVPLGGKPEFLAADGKGKAYVNLADKASVAEVDIKGAKVISTWPTTPGNDPTGMAIDSEGGHLYVGCRNQKMIVMSTKDGAILADLPIGRGVDATAFDSGAGLASCSDGTLTVIRESSPGKFDVAQTLKTARGARTMAVDHQSGRVYLPTADYSSEKDDRGRPKPLPGTFKVLVVERSQK